MTVKQGADISNIHPLIRRAMETTDALWLAFFPEDEDGMTITSGCEGSSGDGVHGDKSKHYPANNASKQGEAVDVRLNDVLQWKATIFCSVLWTILTVNHGDKFKVFAENLLKSSAHCHIEIK